MKHLKQCETCDRRVFRYATTTPRKICATCYYHLNKERIRKLANERAPCSLDGCDEPSVAKGYCDRHYRRFMEYGTPTPERAENWGHAHGHPLYGAWQELKRSGYKRPRMDPQWSSFWQFVKDMGEKPSPRHTLRRRDPNGPYDAANCYWRAPDTDIVIESNNKVARKLWMRTYRVREPKRVLNSDLKKRYGIGVAEYEAMVAKQGGLCAICKRTCQVPSANSDGKLRRLCVDHCHKTKRVRELLCSKCNVIIGFADDNPGILEAAIAYLKKHAAAA